MRRGWLVASLAIAVAVGGCGGEDDSEPEPPVGDAIELTRWLPEGGSFYDSMDVADFKDELGLPEDADPLADKKLSRYTSGNLSGALFATNVQGDVREALDLPAVTQVASFSPSDQAVDPITAMAGADPDRVRDALEALGFVEHDGVLEGPEGWRAEGVDEEDHGSEQQNPLAVRIEDGIIFTSSSAELLQSVRSEPGALPLPVQEELDGDLTQAMLPYACIDGSGYEMDADGSGALIYLVDGGADPESFDAKDGGAFGTPEADGELLRVPFEIDPPNAPTELQVETFASYRCR